MRKEPFITGEYYHIYNRGVDKREIFADYLDVLRFFESLREFNNIKVLGSLYQESFRKNNPSLSPSRAKSDSSLVQCVAFCVLGNHYHLVLKQLVDSGISKFMQKASSGYTQYFNNRYERSGALFQGRFKSSHIDNDNYLQKIVAYVNLNFKVHKKTVGFIEPESLSSWCLYAQGIQNPLLECRIDENIIYGSTEKYTQFAEYCVEDIIKMRIGKTQDLDTDIVKILLE
jgi:REP element-mobilizing transposase RayT